MNKKTIKILSEISKEVPQSLRDKLYKDEYKTPAVKETMERAMVDDSIDDKKKKQIKNLYDAGTFSQVEKVIDEKVGKKISSFIDKRIKEKIVAGEIPDPKSDKKLKAFMKKIWKKTK